MTTRAERMETGRRVRLAIARLQAQGVSARRIAEATGVPPSAIASRMHRHREYVQRGVDPAVPRDPMAPRGTAEPDPALLVELLEALAESRGLTGTETVSAAIPAPRTMPPEAVELAEDARRLHQQAEVLEQQATEARQERNRVLVEMRRRGATVNAIAAAVGLTWSTVRHILSAAGEDEED